MSRPLLRCVGELGGLVGALVHGGGQGNQRVVGLVEDAAAFLDVVAVEADYQRLVGSVAQFGQCADDALGDSVACSDAAEDVHEHGLDLLVAQDDVQAGGHDLGRGAAADVQEVGGLDVAVVLAGVGHDVEGGHNQACTFALASSGSAASLSSSCACLACRKSAFSSRETLPSSATMSPAPVLTSGLTSTRVASSFLKTSQSFRITPATLPRSSSANPAAATISSALAWSMPTAGSMATLARASGRSTASCSRSEEHT